MARKKPQPDKEVEQLDNTRRELFCRYYTQNEATFGNATLSYAAAYDFDLGDLSRRDKEGFVAVDEAKEADYKTCSSNGYRLLRSAEVQERIVMLLNELLKDEVVDSQLAKLIRQDSDSTNKIAAIREYNKLRGRIIDKTQTTNRLPFGEADLSEVIAALPQERQDYFYGIIHQLIEEAELQRRARTAEGGGAR